MCSCEDGNAPSVFERRMAKAHASRNGALHWCCECRRDIALDEWHEDASGLWDGHWSRHRTCLRCVARREAWGAVECTPPFGQLGETITECLVTRDTYRDLQGTRRIRRCVDLRIGREYLAALRTTRAELRAEVARLEAQRFERRRNANLARWAKRVPTHLGEGI